MMNGLLIEASLFGDDTFMAQSGADPLRATLRNVELLKFDDQRLAFERGQLKPVEPAASAAVASVQLDDLVITGDVA